MFVNTFFASGEKVFPAVFQKKKNPKVPLALF